MLRLVVEQWLDGIKTKEKVIDQDLKNINEMELKTKIIRSKFWWSSETSFNKKFYFDLELNLSIRLINS